MLGRVTEYAQELVGDAWMSGMSYPYGEDGLMNHPFVGFDNYDFGVQECTYVVNYAKENFEGWTPEEIRCININYSTSELINNRMFGARDTWKELMPEAADNFWDLDAAAIGMTESAAYDLVSNLLAQHPEITYWCINATIDRFATGANSAIEQYGLLDNTVICVLGGTGLVNQWDQGVENAWKGAIYTAQPVYAEPIFGIMYYMMRGWCTAEEVWQDAQMWTATDMAGCSWHLKPLSMIHIRISLSGLTGTPDLTGQTMVSGTVQSTQSFLTPAYTTQSAHSKLLMKLMKIPQCSAGDFFVQKQIHMVWDCQVKRA